MSVLAELKRRNVFRVAALYLVAGWLLLQVADVLAGVLGLPDWTLRLVAFLLALGFPLALIFSWVYELTPEGLKRESEVDRSESVTAHTGRRLSLVTIVVLVVAVTVLIADRWLPADTGLVQVEADTAMAVAGPAATGQAVTGAVSDKSVAVLPFANLSSDAENAFFASGIHEDILTNLAKLSELRVISRTTVLKYADRQEDIPVIARELGVRYVLEGSVRRAGDRVRVTAQLIDGQNDDHVWAENYDHELDDVFAIQTAVAEDIASAMEAEISPSERALIEARPTDNLAAYELYLKARSAIQRADYGREMFEEAKPLVLAALDLDPEFALAWVLYANVEGQLNWLEFSGPEHAEKAREAVDRALALQPGLPEAIAAEGEYQYRINRDFRAALANFEKAHEQLPNDSMLLRQIGMTQRRLGKFDASIANQRRALALDPDNMQFYTGLAETEFYHGGYRQALGILDQALARAPGKPVFKTFGAFVYLRGFGDIDAAASLLEGTPFSRGFYGTEAPYLFHLYRREYPELLALLDDDEFARNLAGSSGPGGLGVLRGETLLAMGDREAASDAFRAAIVIHETLTETQSRAFDTFATLALAHAYLGDTEEALAMADRLVALRPEARDALEGPEAATVRALVLMLVGETETALGELERLAGRPGGPTPWDLRLDPRWDPLRDEPRFQALVAE